MILGEKVRCDNNTFTNKMNQQAKSFNMTINQTLSIQQVRKIVC